MVHCQSLDEAACRQSVLPKARVLLKATQKLQTGKVDRHVQVFADAEASATLVGAGTSRSWRSDINLCFTCMHLCMHTDCAHKHTHACACMYNMHACVDTLLFSCMRQGIACAVRIIKRGCLTGEPQMLLFKCTPQCAHQGSRPDLCLKRCF